MYIVLRPNHPDLVTQLAPKKSPDKADMVHAPSTQLSRLRAKSVYMTNPTYVRSNV
jgi:hypothetical protein